MATSINSDPDHGEEHELDRGIDPPWSAPDSDDEVHGDQHQLPENVEEEEIQGDERADHARGEQQEGDVKSP